MYKGFTIKFANIDRNRMYRTSRNLPSTAAALYVLNCTRPA